MKDFGKKLGLKLNAVHERKVRDYYLTSIDIKSALWFNVTSGKMDFSEYMILRFREDSLKKILNKIKK